MKFKDSVSFLVCCESSGRVREEMRKNGVDAYSCDLLPADDGSPYHIEGDCREAMQVRKWSGFGFHPDCTYLTVAGIHWNNRGRGWERTQVALAFVKECMALAGDVPWYLENPVSIISTHIRKPDQIIQPYQFGEDASKSTCLWLNRFPRLRTLDDRDWAKPRYICSVCGNRYEAGAGDAWRNSKGAVCCNRCDAPMRSRWSNQTDSGQNKLPPSKDRWKERSKTYLGIASAIGAQWGNFLKFNTEIYG